MLNETNHIMTTSKTIHNQVMKLVNDINFRKAVRDTMVMIGMPVNEWNEFKALIIYNEALKII